MDGDTLAFVGAAGGVGTTRLTVECGTLLAAEGRDVAVLDAAYGTQGLVDLTPGDVEPDMTELCLSDVPLADGLIDRRTGGAGRFAVCPARAPFERLARAKTMEAARAFESRVAEAARAFEVVLLDVPPVASNQAVAAVNAAETVAVVCDAPRAGAALPRMADRLADVGAGPATNVVTRTDEHPSADATVPTFESDLPAVTDDPGAWNAVADVLAATLGVDVEREEEGGLRSYL